jgi:threonine dehydratase
MEVPTLEDVYRARRVVGRYLYRTPLLPSPGLSRLLGCEAYVKYEAILPTGAFKVRGGTNLCSNLTQEEKARGVIAASTGNHGASIAYGCRLFGARAIIAAPEGANDAKLQVIRDLGAEVVLHGRDYDEAREWAEEQVSVRGYRYVHSANEPLLIAGVATMGLEILEDLPEVDTVVVPIGGGSIAAGQVISTKALRPHVRIIGVQAEGAPAVYRSWKARRFITTERADTFAEGLQTRVPFELTNRIIWEGLDDIVLVSDDDLRRAIVTLFQRTHLIAEAAGAAPTAGAYRIREDLKGQKVVLLLSGRNLTLKQLKSILATTEPWE